MDTLLCDELLQEIFHRLPPPSAAAIALVSKRWLRVLRSSTAFLSVHFPPPYDPGKIVSLSTFLAQHPLLSSLSVSGGEGGGDNLLLAVASSCCNLRRLRFCSQVSAVSLCSLSSYCVHLNSIDVTVARPLCFNWLPYFSSLKSLSLSITNSCSEYTNPEVNKIHDDDDDDDDSFNLNLESLSLSGIFPDDVGLSYLYRHCKNVKRLQLMNCQSVGDYSFVRLLSCLKELELRTCRSIVDVVLFKLAEACDSLDSLLLHDGGSWNGLLHFINHSKCNLRRLDLRLPLDLDNNHLIALSEKINFRGLATLRLQSCCFVTGEGLESLGRVLANTLVELALINCDVVGREPGLLTVLGQNLKGLRKLDLSYNGMLVDKELVLMLASCNNLVELKLRGCNRLTNVATCSMLGTCKQLLCVDISYCSGIQVEGVEFFVMNSPKLRRLEVELSKVSEMAKEWARSKFISFIS